MIGESPANSENLHAVELDEGREYDWVIQRREGQSWVQGRPALRRSTLGRDCFYVVKQIHAMPPEETVTVLHYVPAGAAELALFEDPNGALDFAEATVRELRARGSRAELVDPPYGLVGAG